MAFNNQMTKLLDKIERRLGTRALNLPSDNPDMSKNYWATIIKEDTLPTFSRYFPYKFPYIVNSNTPRKDGYYLIDESIVGGLQILGVKDINWQSFSTDSLVQQTGYGYYLPVLNNYSLDEVALAQTQLDTMSLFNKGFFTEWVPPNRFRVTNSMNVDGGTVFNNFKVDILIEHNDILTIAPTKMEIFEKLAMADIATYLYNELKYYEGVETVFANTDMKLSDIQDKANMRDDVISRLEESYVSCANDNQPAIICM